ncbi:MAG: nucleotidyltransferase domain-containing protein [Flammeovirgaceae bacterium]|nr:nucleotidyltransferase domain-containing protein [Flammeovirgaceae bacterium]
MVTIRIAKQRITDLVRDLRAHGYNPSRAILFGSIAKGNAHELSDIDVALWDEKFTGSIPHDIEQIVKILRKYPRMEIHTFHAGETNQDNPFIKEIEKGGVEVPLG